MNKNKMVYILQVEYFIIYRAQNNGRPQIFSSPYQYTAEQTLFWYNKFTVHLEHIGKPMILCNNVPITND